MNPLNSNGSSSTRQSASSTVESCSRAAEPARQSFVDMVRQFFDSQKEWTSDRNPCKGFLTLGR